MAPAESLDAGHPTRETLESLYVVDADVPASTRIRPARRLRSHRGTSSLREIAKVEERYLDLPAISPRAEFRIPWPGGSNRPDPRARARRHRPRRGFRESQQTW